MQKQHIQTNPRPSLVHDGKEIKYFDLNVNTRDHVGSTKQLDSHNFPIIPEGVGQSQRIGKAVDCVRLDFNYEVTGVFQEGSLINPEFSPTTGTTAIARVILVVDGNMRTPTNHPTIIPSDIMQQNLEDDDDLNCYAFQKFETVTDFFILHDKIHRLQPQYMADLQPEGSETFFSFTGEECAPSFNSFDMRGLRIFYGDDEERPWPIQNNIKLLVLSNFDDLVSYRFFLRLYYTD